MKDEEENTVAGGLEPTQPGEVYTPVFELLPNGRRAAPPLPEIAGTPEQQLHRIERWLYDRAVHAELERKDDEIAERIQALNAEKTITDKMMSTPDEQVQSALTWIMGGNEEALPAPSMRSIRELYQVITGDYEWHGVFNPGYSQLSAASTTTLAGMVVNSLNVALHQQWRCGADDGG